MVERPSSPSRNKTLVQKAASIRSLWVVHKAPRYGIVYAAGRIGSSSIPSVASQDNLG